MAIARLFSHVTGVVAAIAITLGLITSPAPAARPVAEPASVTVVVEHLEVAMVGLESVLADAVTGVVNTLKTAALIVLSPVLVPLAFLSIGFTLGGTGICVSTGCEAEWQNPSWVAGRILKAVWSFLGPSSTASPAAAVTAPRAAEAVVGEASPRPASVVTDAQHVSVVPARETRVEAPREARTNVTPRRASSRAAAKSAAPAAAAETLDTRTVDEAPAGRSGKAASQRGRDAATR